MLKETETEETIVFFVTFLSLAAFQLGRGGPGPLPHPPPPPPPGYAYDLCPPMVETYYLLDILRYDTMV